MAKVLAAVRRHSLEPVLAAAEMALESSNTRIERIENVLHRLKTAPPRQQVQTTLAVAEAPVGDSGRCDCLRNEVGHACCCRRTQELASV